VMLPQDLRAGRGAENTQMERVRSLRNFRRKRQMKLPLIITFILFSNISFAANNFNYSAFSGDYKLEFKDPRGDCELNFYRPMKLTNSPKDHFFQATFENGSYLKVEMINQGKRKFNSCWSDGIIGYTETKGKGTIAQEKTVYLKPGFFCRGGSPRYIRWTTWELKGDILSMVNQTSDSPGKLICRFKKTP
jgi:hypothetical protein